MSLQDAIDAYLDCLLWTTTDESGPGRCASPAGA